MVPTGYSAVALNFIGTALPTGAVMTFGVYNEALLNPTQVAQGIDSCLATSGILTRIASVIQVNNIHVKNGPDSTGPFADHAIARNGTGTGESQPNIAVLIQKRTALGGRTNRGRMFLPGIVEADTATGGVLTSTALTQLQSQFSAFLTELGNTDLPMVVLHTSTGTPTPVTSLNVQSRLATQRRRLRR